MKRLFYLIIGLIFLVVLIAFFGNRYLNSGSLEPDNTVWESYIGCLLYTSDAADE